jgi:hypothetical protein
LHITGDACAQDSARSMHSCSPLVRCDSCNGGNTKRLSPRNEPQVERNLDIAHRTPVPSKFDSAGLSCEPSTRFRPPVVVTMYTVYSRKCLSYHFMASPEVAYTETEGIRERSVRTSWDRSVAMKHAARHVKAAETVVSLLQTAASLKGDAMPTWLGCTPRRYTSLQ